MPLLRAGVSIQTMHKLWSAINLFRLQLFSSAFLYPTRQTGLGNTGKKHFYGQRGSKTAIHLGDQGPAPIAKKAAVKVPYWADPGGFRWCLFCITLPFPCSGLAVPTVLILHLQQAPCLFCLPGTWGLVSVLEAEFASLLNQVWSWAAAWLWDQSWFGRKRACWGGRPSCCWPTATRDMRDIT